MHAGQRAARALDKIELHVDCFWNETLPCEELMISESLRAIIVMMSNDSWREEVALLLERCAASLRERRDRQGAADLGAAMAYLQRAQDEGEKGAVTLMAQVSVVRSLDQTERFSFAPGELELLERRSNGK